MSKYRKKPVVIEAEQYSSGKKIEGVCVENCDNVMRGPHIHTLEGIMVVSLGDWVIKGIKGEFYPCKPDIFKLTYDELVEEDS